MRLREVFSEISSAQFHGDSSVTIGGIQMDSNKIQRGDLFVAVRGSKVDGQAFIPQAIQKGAVAVWSETPLENISVPYVVCADPIRNHLGNIAAKIYGDPTKRMTVVGVTGTNGKTTVCHLIEAILKHASLETAYLGTTDYRWKDHSLGADRTTPEATELQQMFSWMLKDGVSSVSMECSSHGIELGRLNGIHFDIAVFTNLTQDHLDFHGDMESYAATKRKLFSELLKNSEKKHKFSIYNIDDTFGKKWFEESGGVHWGYSVENNIKAQVRAERYRLSAEGSEVDVVVEGEKVVIRSALVGLYNVSNLLAAVAAARALSIPLEIIRQSLETFSEVPGRMEKVPNALGLTVIVDYAHTDDAMENVLSTLRPICRGNLIVVFGCGGDRDKTKRPKMMKVVERYADITVVTIDNPRTEAPEKIVADILRGREDTSKKKIIVQLDRKLAIEQGIGLARDLDIVIITGKGHEAYQDIQGKKIPFDDRVIAKKFMENGRAA